MTPDRTACLWWLTRSLSRKLSWRKKLEDCNQHGRIETTDFCLLKNFTEFLKPLQQATKALEGDKYPTLHRVVCRCIGCSSKRFLNRLTVRWVNSWKCEFERHCQRKWKRQFTNWQFLHPQYKILRSSLLKKNGCVHFGQKLRRHAATKRYAHTQPTTTWWNNGYN